MTAFQWNWKFGYQKVNYADGSFNYDGADPARKALMISKPEGSDAHGEEKVGAIRGMNPEDRSYLNFDKIETVRTSDEIPVLVLPVGKRISSSRPPPTSSTRSGFGVPLQARRVPGPEVEPLRKRLQRVSEITETGAFVGRCAEMCGTYHAMMNFEIRVVSADDFKAYLQARMAGKTNSQALQAINQSPGGDQHEAVRHPSRRTSGPCPAVGRRRASRRGGESICGSKPDCSRFSPGSSS